MLFIRNFVNIELIGLLLKFRWWDRRIEEIHALIPLLTCSDTEKVRNEIKKQTEGKAL